MSKEAVLNKIKDVGIVAVIRAESVEQAAKITDACVAGGVTTVELCFTVPNADQLISQMVKKYEGTDVTIVATGMMVQMALKAADILSAEGISARVIDMHTIKPLDTELVLKAAKETGAIVTTEEANVLGGLGAAVAEYLSENYPVPVVRHGVNDEFGRSGKAPLVLDAYGVNADGIIAKVKHFFPIQSDIQRSRPLEVTH